MSGKPVKARAPRRRSDQIGLSREKERMAWELFVNGATYQQIADTRHPGTQEPLYGSPGAAQNAVRRAREYRANEGEIELVREQRLAGLQAQRLDCIRQLGRVQPVFDRAGRPVMVTRQRADGTTESVPQEDQAVRMAIHRTLVMIDRQIANLTGSDAAQRFEIVQGEPAVPQADRIAGLKQRAASITLMPSRAIEAQSVEVRREA